MAKKQTVTATISLLFIALVWGATFTFTKNALTDVGVFTYLFMRFIVAAIILFLIVFVSSRSRSSLGLKTWIVGVVLGLLLFGAYAFQTLGLASISPAMSGFLTGLNVVLVPLFAIPILKIKPKPRTWMATLIAVIGLALISGIGIVAIHGGDMDTIVCAAFIALQILLVERLGGSIDSLALAAIEVLVVAICSLLMISMQHQLVTLSVKVWIEPAVFWAVMVNAVLGTALAYWGQNVLQKHTSSAQTAIIFSTEPVFAALFSWVVLGTTLSVVGWAGGGLIFVSMLIADPNIAWNHVPMFKRLSEGTNHDGK